VSSQTLPNFKSQSWPGRIYFSSVVHKSDERLDLFSHKKSQTLLNERRRLVHSVEGVADLAMLRYETLSWVPSDWVGGSFFLFLVHSHYARETPQYLTVPFIPPLRDCISISGSFKCAQGSFVASLGLQFQWVYIKLREKNCNTLQHVATHVGVYIYTKKSMIECRNFRRPSEADLQSTSHRFPPTSPGDSFGSRPQLR